MPTEWFGCGRNRNKTTNPKGSIVKVRTDGHAGATNFVGVILDVR